MTRPATVRGVALIVGAGVMLAGALAGADAGRDDRVVVAELFTSEGCSSCPPADAVLSQIVTGPANGIVVLGLGEHVDYWDGLGWKDPFSSSAFTRRQTEYYDRVFRNRSVYTPQLVIDGHIEAIGSDIGAVREAISAAAKVLKAPISVTAWSAGASLVNVQVRVTVPAIVTMREEADVVVALVQDRLVSQVSRGENRGRTLTHSAVTRSLTAIGSLKPSLRTFEMTSTLPVAGDWTLADIRVVALLQERRSRRIVGAGSARITGHEGPHSTE